MRAVLQRVSEANVAVEGRKVAEMKNGLLILLGIEADDNSDDIAWLSHKISNLRIFNDSEGIMNRSLLNTQGDAIVVSQFTLYANIKKGNRPSYSKAAGPNIAIPLYERFIHNLENILGKKVGTGIFGADMQVELSNDGPVTILIDTKNKE